MKITERFTYWAAVALGLILVNMVGAGGEDTRVIVSFEETEGAPKISEEESLRLARAYTGLSEKTPVKARYGQATDTSILFFEVVRRPAWEVAFEGVKVAITNPDGTQKRNPHITKITVLLDAESGALLKVSSPPPADPKDQAAPFREVNYVRSQGLALKSTPTKPRIPFLQALQHLPGKGGEVPEAKQVVAYFGLLTDTVRLRDKIKDKPYWILFLGGVKSPPASGPGGHRSSPHAKSIVVLDAETGRWHLMYGR